MAKTDVAHHEQWTLLITLEKGDEPWPDLQAYERGPVFRPDQLAVKLVRGADRPSITASGGRLTSSGNVGKGRSHRHFYSRGDLPGWAAEAVEQARKQHDLGPGVTGVDWLWRSRRPSTWC